MTQLFEHHPLDNLYNSYSDAAQLKQELGSFALSFFYVNQNAFHLNQKLSPSKILNSDNFLLSNNIKSYPWLLLIELPYNKYMLPGILAMVNERLGYNGCTGGGIIEQLKSTFKINKKHTTNELIKKNPPHLCQTLSLTLPNDINLLLFAYHTLYITNLEANLKLNLYIDISSNEKIKLSTKIYYESRSEKQKILCYMLDTIRRLKLKI